MEANELKTIFNFMNEQELRLSGQIKAVHECVKDTNVKVKEMNGRVRELEVDVAKVETTCLIRKDVVDTAIERVEPTIVVTKFLKTITKHPKVSIFIFLMTVTFIQSMVLLFIDKQWISKIFEKWL